MKKRPRTLVQMAPLIKEWQKTGMNKKMFCRTHQINVHTFSYWVDKWDKLEKGSKGSTEGTENQATKSGGFVQIESVARQNSDNRMSVAMLEFQFPKGAILRLSSMIGERELNTVKTLLY